MSAALARLWRVLATRAPVLVVRFVGFVRRENEALFPVEEFVVQVPIECFDEGVLLGLAGRNVVLAGKPGEVQSDGRVKFEIWISISQKSPMCPSRKLRKLLRSKCTGRRVGNS